MKFAMAKSSQFVLIAIILLLSIIYLNSWFRYQYEDSGPPQGDIIFNLETPLTTLIVVPCHSSYRGSFYSPNAVRNEKNWFLFSNQAGFVQEFIQHMKVGVEIASSMKDSLLVFSGGQTRPIGPISEGQSYWYIVHRAFNWFGHPEVALRTTSEEFALDSFDNLLHSVCRFYQVTKTYPKRIIVVGFPFKKNRFVNLHRKAIGFPEEHFKYISVDYVSKNHDFESMEKGEKENAADLFSRDPFGCMDPLLVRKKEGRNPNKRISGYEASCGVGLSEMLSYCGKEPFPGKLPWETEL